MSFWTDKTYKVRLTDFIERFVAHNTKVKLYSMKRVRNEDGMVNQYEQLWSGMDWQITEGYINSDYFRVHPNVLPCPYGEANVVALTSVGISGNFADDVSLIIEV